jgi:hypothetical protein
MTVRHMRMPVAARVMSVHVRVPADRHYPIVIGVVVMIVVLIVVLVLMLVRDHHFVPVFVIVPIEKQENDGADKDHGSDELNGCNTLR